MFKVKPTTGGILFLLSFAALIIIGGPLAMIWAVNTLFPSVAIPYTLETWLAAFIIPAVFKSNVTVNK